MEAMERLPVYLLAGGASSRFGEDKARAMLHGRTLLECAAEPLRARASAITVVADRSDRYADLGFRTIGDLDRGGDVRRGRGPLAGIDAALADLPITSGDWVLITAGDFVGADARWIDRLLAARASGSPVVAFRGDRWEPMFALYHRSFRDHLASALASDRDDPSAWRVLERANATSVSLPDDWARGRSIDTREALARFSAESPDALVHPGGPPATETPTTETPA